MLEGLGRIQSPWVRSLTAAATAFSVVTLVGAIAIGTTSKDKSAYRWGVYAALLATGGGAALGLVYISLCWGLMMDLYKPNEIVLDRPYDLPIRFLPVIIIFSIWINDTMAYIVGSLIGKRPLSKISPKKTWEGTIGGIILAVTTIGFIIIALFKDENVSSSYHWFVIPAIAATTGTFGDLLESKLKRMADVKDSGSLMPGHGGFLDRFDSLLLATPFVWLYVQLFMK